MSNEIGYPSGTKILNSLTYNELTNVILILEEMICEELNRLSGSRIRSISGYPPRDKNKYLEEMREYLNDIEIEGCERYGDEYMILEKGSLGVLADFSYSSLNDFRQTLIRKTI